MGWVSEEVQKSFEKEVLKQIVLIDNLTSFKFHADEAHHRNMGLWNFQEDCSIVMVLWIWAFCTIFLSNYFTLIVLCLDVCLCELYSQSWQMGCQNNSEGHNSICPCQTYGVCWLTNRLPNFATEWMVMGCISAFFLLAFFCQKAI